MTSLAIVVHAYANVMPCSVRRASSWSEYHRKLSRSANLHYAVLQSWLGDSSQVSHASLKARLRRLRGLVLVTMRLGRNTIMNFVSVGLLNIAAISTAPLGNLIRALARAGVVVLSWLYHYRVVAVQEHEHQQTVQGSHVGCQTEFSTRIDATTELLNRSRLVSCAVPALCGKDDRDRNACDRCYRRHGIALRWNV